MMLLLSGDLSAGVLGLILSAKYVIITDKAIKTRPNAIVIINFGIAFDLFD